MPEFKVARPLKRPPVHPSALMREILQEYLKLPIAEAARRMKISRQSLYAALNGHGAVKADIALRFARLTSGRPELYLHMQESHELWHARQRLEKVLKQIEPVAAD